MKYTLDADHGVFLDLKLTDARGNIKTLEQIPAEQITVAVSDPAILSASQDGDNGPIKVLPVAVGSGQVTVTFQEDENSAPITAVAEIEVIAGKVVALDLSPRGTFPIEPPPG